MTPARTPFEDRVERYGRWIVKRRWSVVIAAVLAIVALAAGAVNLGLSSNYRVYSARRPRPAAARRG